jgi:hypothetical protein
MSLKSASGGSGKKVSRRISAFSLDLTASLLVFEHLIVGVTLVGWSTLLRAHLAIFQRGSGDLAASSTQSLCASQSAFLTICVFSSVLCGIAPMSL